MDNFRNPSSLSDDEVVEGVAFWDQRIQYFIAEGELDSIEPARESHHDFVSEAEKRGLRRQAQRRPS
ncbi:hypothetical protein ACFWCF_25350 [Rhodococcus sp. NPDC060090]|uniref:hypothetical protein n=1 Tax=Rhodococcus sp. NPDC060090 TaxID=3347056 RepID=UPI003651A13C